MASSLTALDALLCSLTDLRDASVKLLERLSRPDGGGPRSRGAGAVCPLQLTDPQLAGIIADGDKWLASTFGGAKSWRGWGIAADDTKPKRWWRLRRGAKAAKQAVQAVEALQQERREVGVVADSEAAGGVLTALCCLGLEPSDVLAIAERIAVAASLDFLTAANLAAALADEAAVVEASNIEAAAVEEDDETDVDVLRFHAMVERTRDVLAYKMPTRTNNIASLCGRDRELQRQVGRDAAATRPVRACVRACVPTSSTCTVQCVYILPTD